MIKNAIFFIVIAALAALPAFATPRDSVTGNWDATFQISGFTLPGTISLKVEGDVLTGTCDTEHTGPGTITGTVKDGKLIFMAKFEKHESIDFTGMFADGKLAGEFKTEGNTGQWSALRHKT